MEMQVVDSDLFIRVVHHFWEQFRILPESATRDDVVFIQYLLSHWTSFCNESE